MNIKKTLLALCIFLICLEVLLRVFFSTISSPKERETLEKFLRFEADDKIMHEVRPYQTYVNTPFFENENGLQHNSIGLRQENEVREVKNAYRILCLGGSTTYGYNVKNPSDAWPKKLEKNLKTRLGTKVEVLNGGINGGTSADVLSHFLFNYQYLDLDMVIVHGNINDIRPSIIKDYRTDYSHWMQFKAGNTRFLTTLEKKAITYSKIIAFIYLKIYKNKVPVSDNTLYVNTIEDKSYLAEKPFTSLAFEHNIENLFLILQAKNITPVYFQVPINREAGKSSKLIQFYEQHGIIDLYYQQKALARKICEKHQIPFLELTENALLGTYNDICHVNKQGHQIKAEFLSKELMKLIDTKTKVVD